MNINKELEALNTILEDLNNPEVKGVSITSSKTRVRLGLASFEELFWSDERKETPWNGQLKIEVNYAGVNFWTLEKAHAQH